MLSLKVKTLDAFKFDGVAESDNTRWDSVHQPWDIQNRHSSYSW